jgi:hypothetical protein
VSSPIAHSLVGLALGRTIGPRGVRQNPGWYLYAALAANVADFDFLAGAALGDVNLLHRGASHSLLAACAFGAVSTLLARPLGKSMRDMFVAGTILYASHLLIDLFCGLPGMSAGMPLTWPISDHMFRSPWQPLLGIWHGGPHDDPRQVLDLLFSRANLTAILRELAIFLPIAAWAWWAMPAKQPDPARQDQPPQA